MCVIAICEKTKLNRETFNACWDSNRDGFGYAHWTGEKIVFVKGIMNKDAAWDAYQKAELPHVAHFRIASAGGVCPELTHPFICSPKSGLMLEHEGITPVLFHNGTLSEWRSMLMTSIFHTKIIPKGPMSDSRAMAIALSVLGPEFLSMYASNRWVCVAKDGYVKVGDWTEGEGGVMFSNSSFRVQPEPRIPAQGGSYWPKVGPFAGAQTTLIQTEEKEVAETVNVRQAHSCLSCDEYAGKMKCKSKGKMKDMLACKEWRPSPTTGPLSFERGSARRACHMCLSFAGDGTCSLKNITLKDDVACGVFKKKPGYVEPGSVGGVAEVVNGKVVSVEDNFLDRLKYHGSPVVLRNVSLPLNRCSECEWKTDIEPKDEVFSDESFHEYSHGPFCTLHGRSLKDDVACSSYKKGDN